MERKTRREIIEDMHRNAFNILDEYKSLPHEEVVKIQRSLALDYSVCTFNVVGDLNIGSIIRTSALLGAKRVLIFGKKKFDKRSTVGADNYIEIVKIKTIDRDRKISKNRFFSVIDHYNYTPIFFETGGTDLRDFDFTGIDNPLLVFGSESDGIPEDILYERNYPIVSIPHFSVMRSLNVGAAAAIAMWEYIRQTTTVLKHEFKFLRRRK